MPIFHTPTKGFSNLSTLYKRALSKAEKVEKGFKVSPTDSVCILWRNMQDVLLPSCPKTVGGYVDRLVYLDYFACKFNTWFDTNMIDDSVVHRQVLYQFKQEMEKVCIPIMIK